MVIDRGLRLGHVRGIEVRVNWSVLVIAWLICWSLAESVLPRLAENYRTGEYWAAGGVTAVLFFVSLGLHELGHSVTAQRHGVRVESITLWLFGGVARLGGPAADARSEWRIAAAGPAVSIAIALAAGAVAAVAALLGASPLVVAAVGWLAVTNGILAAFNLLPAFPLDGGRLWQAHLWKSLGDRPAATRRAAELGRQIGAGLIALGVLEAALADIVGGLWLVVLGWFLREAAASESAATTAEELLRGHRVGELMSPNPIVVHADLPVSDLLEREILHHRHSTFPVVGADGRVCGLVGLAEVRATPRESWPRLRTGDIASAELLLVGVADPVLPTLATLGPVTRRAIVVDPAGRPVGIVAPSDLSRYLVTLGVIAGTDLPVQAV
ncbi:MAG: site-2 protease family protein [Acidimicrobiales bacterium]|nr:site-2 protease family protein [Acidimicrobiales bacterium]